MNRVGLFSIILSCLSIPMKGFSIEKSLEREIDIFGAKLSPEEFRSENVKYVKILRNQLANPCENFKDYACGILNNDLTKSMLSNLQIRYLEGVFSLSEALTKNLDGNENYEPVTPLEKYKIYYSSCIYQNKDKTTYFEDILKVLEPYGGVPFWNKNWKSNNFDWVKFSAFTMRLNIPTLFEVYHHLNDEGIYEYRIEMANVDHTSEQYEEFLVQNIKLMGIETETAVETAKEILLLKKALREIESYEEESMTLEEFIKKYPEINWKSYFSIVFEKNEGDLDLSEVIRVIGSNNIKKVVEVISNTKPEIVANYMGWQILEAAINSFEEPHLNKFENLSTDYGFGNILTKTKSYFKTNCFKEVNAIFAPLLTSLFFNEYYDKTSEEELIKIGYEIKSNLQNLLGRNSWLANKTDVEHLNSIKFEFDLPKLLSTTELNELYADFKVTPKKYIENWFNLRKLQTNENRNLFDSTHWAYPITGRGMSGVETIKLPLFYLMLPQFHRYSPEGLKFGFGLGMVRKLLESNPNYWKEDFASKTESQELWECYEKEFNIAHSDSKFGINELIMVQTALRAYKSKMNNLRKPGGEKLPEYDLSENQLFFLHAGQLICYSSDKYKETLSKFFANMDEFAETFSCPLGSPMNPTKKCKIF